MIVKTFKTKKEKEAIIRYPTIGDLDAMTGYINNLSQEDTYIRFSGEEITKEEEAKFLTATLSDIEKGDKVMLQCWINNHLVGICNIDRNKESRKRELHTGIFGIAVIQDTRGQGIGYELAKTTIEEAKKRINGLKLIILNVYEPNVVGRALYKHLGFKEAGVVPRACLYRGQYIGKITMYLDV